MSTNLRPLDGLAAEINLEHSAASTAAREALGHARRAGELLLAAKKQVKHGDWLSWLAANFQFTARTAQNYMRLSEHWGELQAKSETVAHLSLRDALALLSPAKELEPHEYCLIFPPMSDEEFEDLKEGFRRNGYIAQCGKITLYQGQILDGKMRYAACLAVGVEPAFEDFVEVQARGYRGDALAFVRSANLMRHHPSPADTGAAESGLVRLVGAAAK